MLCLTVGEWSDGLILCWAGMALYKDTIEVLDLDQLCPKPQGMILTKLW